MPLALGQRLVLHHFFGHGIVALVAIAAAILLMRFWPLIVRWFENRR
jgi:hypothetical protein